MKLDSNRIPILQEMLTLLEQGFSSLPDTRDSVDEDALREVLFEVAERMRDNYPYQHPLYAGQMLKPPHPVARLAYALSLWINPNNHALDGGRASSAMEKEAVAALAGLFGWKTHLGHLTSGGTMANLEALWVAGRLKPGLSIAASEQAHYTHERISQVLGLPFRSVPCDRSARMDVDILARMLGEGDVGTVVATVGTTGTGAVDPLAEILELQKRFGFRLHVDAAYGGYHVLTGNLRTDTRRAYDLLGEADSIVIDPWSVRAPVPQRLPSGPPNVSCPWSGEASSPACWNAHGRRRFSSASVSAHTPGFSRCSSPSSTSWCGRPKLTVSA
jgi:tyrosine decarboxylase/aspartate 1-decarboxylase